MSEQSSSPKPIITIEKDLSGFFHPLLSDAATRNRIDISDAAIAYLVDLLRSYSVPTEPLSVAGERLDDLPLAILLSKALAANITDKISLLRVLGDRSLYISGFFSDSLSREAVDVDYYINMGGSAYDMLASSVIYSANGRVMQALYKELSAKFHLLVDLLDYVSEHCAIQSNEGLLRTYEKWLKTKSTRLARRLEEQGIVPTDSTVSAYVQ